MTDLPNREALADTEARHAHRDLLAEKDAEIERLTALLTWAHDTLLEINPSNYDHDDVCNLNAASVEVALAIAPHIKEPSNA